MKFLLAALALVVPVAVAFYAGVFSTSFETDLCYSDVLAKLADKAQAAAASQDSAAMVRSATLMKSLPTRGYESQCKKILAAVEADSALPPTSNAVPAGR